MKIVFTMMVLLLIAAVGLAVADDTILPSGAVTNGGTAWGGGGGGGGGACIQASVGQTFASAPPIGPGGATTIADAGFWTCLYVESSPAGWINPGWNWIGLPSHPSFPAVSTIFTTDPVNRLYKWDWLNKTTWGYPSDFNTMELRTGYVDLEWAGQNPYYSGYLPITPVDDDTAPDYRSVTVDIPAAGVIWLGHPMPWPIELSSVKVQYAGVVRTAAQDSANPHPWLNWNWTYWDSYGDTALICGLSGADDHILRPWHHYRIWFNVPAVPNDPNGPFLIFPEPSP